MLSDYIHAGFPDAVIRHAKHEAPKLGKYKIKEVLSRYKPSYIVDGKETTPGQMMATMP